jgi:hypothetical protein
MPSLSTVYRLLTIALLFWSARQERIHQPPNIFLHFFHWPARIHDLNPTWLPASDCQVAFPNPLLKLQPGSLEAAVTGFLPRLASCGTLKRHMGSQIQN